MKILNKLKNDRQDLINNLNENIVSLEKIAYEQQAEIERLKADLEYYQKGCHNLCKELDAEKIKNF